MCVCTRAYSVYMERCVHVHERIVCIWRGVCGCDRGGREETHVKGGNAVNVCTMTRSDYRYKTTN